MQALNPHIKLTGINLYGHHGNSKEEQRVGSWYEIDIDLHATITNQALEHDNLDGTVDYALVADVVKKEFAVSANLLEHLAWRMAKAIFLCSQSVEKVGISIKKIAPPIHGKVESSAVDILFGR